MRDADAGPVAGQGRARAAGGHRGGRARRRSATPSSARSSGSSTSSCRSPAAASRSSSRCCRRRSQRLGDLVAGTIVLRERTASRAGHGGVVQPARRARGLRRRRSTCAPVTDAQFAVVRSFLAAGARAGPRGPRPPGAAPGHAAGRRHAPHAARRASHPELFLVCVAAAYQRRRARRRPPPPAPPPPPPPPPPPAAAAVAAAPPPPPRRPAARAAPAVTAPAATPRRADVTRAWHYLDHAATTPLRPEALAAMVPALRDGVRQPVGRPRAGPRALGPPSTRPATTWPRCVGCEPGEVVFTSGGTEADNLAVRGVLGAAWRHGGVHGHRAPRRAPPGGGGWGPASSASTRRGLVDLDALAAALDDDVALVSVMLVNNEVGTIQPLAEIAEVVRARAPRRRAPHRRRPGAAWLDVPRGGGPADLVSLAAHKCGGPVGIGALVVRAGRRAAAPSSSVAGRSASGAAARRTWPAPSGFAAAADGRRRGTADAGGARRTRGATTLVGGRPRRRAGRGRERRPRGRRTRPPGRRHRQRLPPGRRQRGAPVPARARARRAGQRRVELRQRRPGAVARAGRHGRATGRWPPGRCGCRSAGPPPRPTSTPRRRRCPRRSRRLQAHARDGAPA